MLTPVDRLRSTLAHTSTCSSRVAPAQIEVNWAAVEAQRYQVEAAVYLTPLTSNFVTTAIREASLRAAARLCARCCRRSASS